MLAPVYRHLGTRAGLLGVSPAAWMPLALIAFAGMELDRPNQGVLVAAALYALVRFAESGRADGFALHWLMWKRRQRETEGRLCAAARGRRPQFPFGEYEFRDRGIAVRRRDDGEGGAKGEPRTVS